ncbi:MAG TPA: hypothetical protein VD790_03930 [Thermoleophilaceae bacterium]|nr:hypothetical protein [Thermoleophilaceae bacterium]
MLYVRVDFAGAVLVLDRLGELALGLRTMLLRALPELAGLLAAALEATLALLAHESEHDQGE